MTDLHELDRRVLEAVREINERPTRTWVKLEELDGSIEPAISRTKIGESLHRLADAGELEQREGSTGRWHSYRPAREVVA